jgi:16S rRNA processing protein RimM
MTGRARKRIGNSGSPQSGEPEYLVVGLLRRPHGVRGDLLMEVLTDFPERLQVGARLFVGSRYTPAVIDARRPHAAGMIVHLQGVDTPEAAGAYRNQPVYVHSADRPRLPEGQYYHHQLIGLAVIDEQDAEIGRLTEILQTGANDVYVVKRPDNTELLLPAIAGVILNVEPAAGRIRVSIPAGLAEDVAE